MRSSLTVAALAASSLVAAASGAIYYDGTFNPIDWSTSTSVNASGVGSTATGAQVLTGGNTNEYWRVGHNLVVGSAGNGALFSLHMKASAIYDPSTQGAISTINYSEDSIAFAGPGNVQGSGLAIIQGGRYYLQRNPILVMPLPTFANWTTQSAPGLVASDLYELIPATGTLIPGNNPDFSGTGSPMQLGFWRGNSNNGSVSTDAGIDNWTVEIVPAPGTVGLLAMGGVMAARRRRSR
jgi:hypothetical protein